MLQRFANEWIKRTSIMIGIVVGTLVAIPLGFTDFGNVGDSNVFGVPTPFHFGAPTFALSVVVTMVIVMIVSMIETTGDLIAVGEIVGKEADEETIVGGLRADGFSSALGGIFNTFPYTAYAENVGLVSLSGVKSRWVVATAGGIMVVLGLFPILGAVVAAVPLPVLGGAGLVMFGTVAAIGAKTLNKVDFDHRGNLIIVAVSLGIGLVPVRNEAIYADFPQWFTTIMGSGHHRGHDRRRRRSTTSSTNSAWGAQDRRGAAVDADLRRRRGSRSRRPRPSSSHRCGSPSTAARSRRWTPPGPNTPPAISSSRMAGSRRSETDPPTATP